MNTKIDRNTLDLGEFTTQVDDTYRALRAFNFLFEHVNEYAPGGVSGTIAYGISRLLRRQVDDMEEIVGKVFVLAKRLRLAEKAAESAKASGLPEGWVTPPIYRPGMEHDLRTKVAAPEAAEKLRGADLEAVARDTHLAEATVRRVVERLLAEPDADPGAAVIND